MAEKPILVPVILSGGTGSRLWPVSRESHPKPFMRLPDGESLLQKTMLRSMTLSNLAQLMIVTNEAYYLKTAAEYHEINENDPAVLTYLLEPSARNTAPAITLSALYAQRFIHPDSIILIQPADHLIEDIHAFQSACDVAVTLANENHIVTFGIKPTRPETGFGYIESGSAISDTPLSYRVKRFHEKPSADVAEMYLASGNYFWNAGLFCFKVSTFLNELRELAPTILTTAEKCFNKTVDKMQRTRVCKFESDSFETLPSISIDYALMEKSSKLAVIACDFNWQDVGSWENYKQLYPSDDQGNTVVGDAILMDTTNNFILGQDRMIATIGVDHLAIIDTPDALLVTHRDKTQEVKHIVEQLKAKSHESYLTHRTVSRPWGTYTVLEEGVAFKIKRIVVKPQQTLSLQLHQHRSEHWIVVEGIATVVNGDKSYTLNTNESTFVPMQTPHRLSNPGDSDLVIIEVQTGSYLGEDDITRLEDTYGRVTS